jgi:mitochondrial fission factor
MANQNYEEEYNNANYAHLINEQMRVPKRIKATGEYYDEHEHNNGYLPWNYQDKIEMNVPERIVVTGSNQTLGKNLFLSYVSCSCPYSNSFQNCRITNTKG